MATRKVALVFVEGFRALLGTRCAQLHPEARAAKMRTRFAKKRKNRVEKRSQFWDRFQVPKMGPLFGPPIRDILGGPESGPIFGTGKRSHFWDRLAVRVCGPLHACILASSRALRAYRARIVAQRSRINRPSSRTARVACAHDFHTADDGVES